MKDALKVRPLASFAKVQGGFSFRSSDFCSEGIPVVKIKNITPPTVDVHNVDYVSKEVVEEIPRVQRFVVQQGDILIAMTGATLGKVGQVPHLDQEVLLNQRVGRIDMTNPSEVDGEYLFYVLSYDLNATQISNMGQGSAQANISSAEIESLEVTLPSLTEQRAIALALRTVQRAKAAKQRELKLERERKAALMQYLFAYGISGVAPNQTEIGGISQRWKVVELGDKDVTRTLTGGTPSRKVSDYFGGNIPWVKSGELNDTRIIDSEEKITQKGLENSNARMVPAGTLLIAMYGATAGKTGVLSIEAATNQAVCAIFPVNDSFNSIFLQHYLIYIRPKILSARSGGAQPNINQQIIRALKVPQPPISEQIFLGNVLDKIDQKIASVSHEIYLMEELFRAILEELMAGRLSSEPLIKVGAA
jgi:type I restriction enzyme S subunit